MSTSWNRGKGDHVNSSLQSRCSKIFLLQSEFIKDINEEGSTKINCTIDENRQSETETAKMQVPTL